MHLNVALMKMLPEAYFKSLENLVNFVIESEGPTIKTAVLIGSPTHAKKARDYGDLDLCFYINKICESKALINKIKETFEGKNNIQILEEPRYLRDFQTSRIELTIRVHGIQYELTYLDFTLNNEFTPHLVPKDDFELYIGNLLSHGICVYGENYIRYKNLKNVFLPYYNENLRKKRLVSLTKAFDNKIGALKRISDDKMARIRVLNSVLKILIQYAFIRKKVYPYSYEKWLKKQFLLLLKSEELYEKIEDAYSVKYSTGIQINKLKSIKEMCDGRYLG